jgi:hypothetical protein
MKVRIIKEPDGGYQVQIKRWYWPFWINRHWSAVESYAIECAKRLADPSLAIIWSSEAAPCK